MNVDSEYTYDIKKSSFDNLLDKATSAVQEFEISTSDKNVVSNDVASKGEHGTDKNEFITRVDEITADNSLMKQSFTKDSESSESIDSVEQSEHALLELCIQPGIKSEGNTTIIESNVNYINSQFEWDIKQMDHVTGKNNASEDVSEIDGNMSDKLDATFEIVRTTDILHYDDVKKYVKEETYRRQRDPDAMIASLDRLTATLVQQTEAMRERESSAMKQSLVSDTWNEDSPNDVSFPSISISAPLVASFNSDAQEDQHVNVSEVVQTESNEHTGMTESKIIQREAIKLAEAVDAEANNQHYLETTSLTSIDLEAIKPPSSMGSLVSLTASYAGTADTSETFVNRDRCYSTSLLPSQVRNSSVTTDPRNVRKKSLPLGVVAKRALGQGAQSHTASLENLLNECTSSQLENVKPPSMMDELPDMGDMENSMLSVASITSEIADSRDQDSHSLTGSDPVVFEMMKPIANVLSMTCMRYSGEGMQSSANNSLSECLENINPPSLFNEVSEMDESTMEAASDTFCSDTLCIDTELHTDEVTVHSIVAEVIDEVENDTDEAATPISSEYCVSSSAESTPKKRLHKSYLTPKQKRNLTKERYKTYTIAAEMVKKEEERRKQDGTTGESDKIPRRRCSPFSKLTPKQRRQEDRARFQTQVLGNPFPDLNMIQSNKEEVQQVPSGNTIAKQEVTSPVKSSIPTLTKLPVCRALRRKRADSQENKERYRTRTLNDAETVFKEMERNPVSHLGATEQRQVDSHKYAREEIQNVLEQNTTIELNKSNKANDSMMDDTLRCETITLANRSESDQNSRMYRFVNGVSKNLIGTQQTEDAQTFIANINDEDMQSDNEEVVHEALYSADPIQSDSDQESNCADEEQEPRETKRPRIIKPGVPGRDGSVDSNATDKSEPESPKAIRGRRKALYSNPITRKPTPQSSPLKQVNPVSGIPIGRSNTSPIVRATRATTLRQNSSSTNIAKDSPKSNTSPKMTPLYADVEKRVRNPTALSNRASIPQKGSSLTYTKSTNRHSTPPTCSSSFQSDGKPTPEVPIKPLERQGTFTKDEPEVENAPTVLSATSSPVKTKIAKPIRGVSSKVHPAVGKSKISVKTQAYQPKITKANSAEKMQSSKGLSLLVAPKKIPSGKIAVPAKALNASSNDSGKNFRKVDPLEQRSNSNSSIVSNSSPNVQNRAKLTKEATSKIASLWKKVEESKNKQRTEKPDTRQWIRPANSATEVDDASVACGKPSAFRLFRSSTFEGISQEDCSSGDTSACKSKSKRPPPLSGVQSSGGVKYRNSCDLTGMNASEAPCKIPVKSSESYKREITQLSDALVTMRKQQDAEFEAETDPTKRISRLGSFIRVDGTTMENGGGGGSYVRTPASAIVSPFNYNPRLDVPSQMGKTRSPDGSQGIFDTAECRAEMVTGSARVTTV